MFHVKHEVAIDTVRELHGRRVPDGRRMTASYVDEYRRGLIHDSKFREFTGL